MKMSTYLDYNATAPMRAEALAAFVQASEVAGNPASVHGSGRNSRAILETARRVLAESVGCKTAELIFTSGGTEADNLALLGTSSSRILTSAIEHDAVLAASPNAVRLPVSRDGVVDLEHLQRELAKSDDKPLVSILWVNNETGVIQPIGEIARLVHDAGGLLHVDAVQGFTKLPNVELLGADLISLSAHKIGGPVGVGALVVREGIALQARNLGGGQELGRRSGTQNVAGAVAFAKAAEVADAARKAETERLSGLRTQLEEAILGTAPEAIISGKEAKRVANTSNIILPGVPAETQVMSLDLAGFAVSAGSACSSGKVTKSHVLDAMYGDDGLSGSGIRVSLGYRTTAEEVSAFVAAWSSMRDRLSPAAKG